MSRNNVEILFIFGLSVLGLSACTGSDGYRTAPESQIYAIEEVEDVQRGQRVQIIKQASTEERQEKVVLQSEAAAYEYEDTNANAGTIIEEEIETIQVSNEAGNASEEEVIEQVKEASHKEKVAAPAKKETKKTNYGFEEMEFINEDAGVEATIVQPAALISPQVVEILEDEALMAGEESCPDDVHTATTTTSIITTSTGFPVVHQGFYYFERDCNMREAPGTQSYVYDVISAGRRLWVEDHNGEWAKVYRNEGPAFVHKGCLSLN